MGLIRLPSGLSFSSDLVRGVRQARASNGEDTRNEDSHFRFSRVSFDGLRKKERLLVARVLCTAKWDSLLLKCMM